MQLILLQRILLLKRINAYMNYSDEDEDYDPQLEDWFKEEGTVEFEFSTDEVDEDGNAVTSFVPPRFNGL